MRKPLNYITLHYLKVFFLLLGTVMTQVRPGRPIAQIMLYRNVESCNISSTAGGLLCMVIVGQNLCVLCSNGYCTCLMHFRMSQNLTCSISQR